MPDHPLSPGGETLAILDANVLIPPRLCDILFDLFLEDLYYPRWTPDIEAEFLNNYGHVVLAKNKAQSRAIKTARPDPNNIIRAKRRLHCFRAAVGAEYQVFLYDTSAYINQVPEKVDIGDIHVAAASLVLFKLAKEERSANKIYVVSNNFRHLAVKDMKAIGIDVVSGGMFINELNHIAPVRVEKALLRTCEDLGYPPVSRTDLLGLLVVHGAETTADFYSAKWNVKISERRAAR